MLPPFPLCEVDRVAKDEKLELLRRVPLFSRMSGRDLLRVGMLADEVDLEKERVLMRQGERGEEMFVLVQGQASIERDGQRIGLRGAGDFFGEIALLDGGPRTATVRLTTDSRLLVIGRRDFHAMIDEFPEIRMRVLEALAQRVRSTEPESAH